MNINFEPNKKQFQMFEAFDAPEVTEVLYGGAASGGKSYGLAALHITKSLQYKGIRSLIGRHELKNLKQTTLQSFFKVCAAWGLKSEVHFNYNKTEGIITFFNGSQILLRGLPFLPSDPHCEYLGSLELTFASIDEAGETHQKVKEVLHSRCGRWLNEHFGIKPMLYLYSNPARNYLFRQFYQPSKNGTLASNRMFIQALITDHDKKFKDFDPQAYAEHLRKTLSFADYQRLVLGKWEFDDDPNALTTFAAINKAFDHVKKEQDSSKAYITADIAFESDKCVVCVWSGLAVVKIVVVEKNEKPEEIITKLAQEYSVPKSSIVYDATGAGNYLKNYLQGAYAFHSGAKPLKGEKYEHLKTQCYFYLAKAFNEETIQIFDTVYQDEIVDECLQIKTIPKEKLESKVKMIKKEQIKKVIGRSPDILDALSMRFVFEIKGKFQSCI